MGLVRRRCLPCTSRSTLQYFYFVLSLIWCALPNDPKKSGIRVTVWKKTYISEWINEDFFSVRIAWRSDDLLVEKDEVLLTWRQNAVHQSESTPMLTYDRPSIPKFLITTLYFFGRLQEKKRESKWRGSEEVWGGDQKLMKSWWRDKWR